MERGPRRREDSCLRWNYLHQLQRRVHYSRCPVLDNSQDFCFNSLIFFLGKSIFRQSAIKCELFSLCIVSFLEVRFYYFYMQFGIRILIPFHSGIPILNSNCPKNAWNVCVDLLVSHLKWSLKCVFPLPVQTQPVFFSSAPWKSQWSGLWLGSLSLWAVQR